MFFIKENWFGHFWCDSVRICKLLKIQAIQVNESGKILDVQARSRNLSLMHDALPESSFPMKCNDSLMCEKFQVILMQYGELPNEEIYHRHALRCLFGNRN